MEYEIIRKPFMLYETVAMFYKYINGITFQQDLNTRNKFVAGSVLHNAALKRCARLQQIMEVVCHDVDPNAQAMRKFFGSLSAGYEDICLAQVMTHSFCTLKYPDFRENVDEILRIWEELQDRHAWIHPGGVGVLVFTDGPDCPGNLIKQIRGLKYPVEFKLELCETLTSFDESMQELASMIEPYAIKLKEAYDTEPDLFGEVESYWREEFQKRSPIEFMAVSVGEDVVAGAGEKTVVALSLMNTRLLNGDMANDCLFCSEHNTMYIGSHITSNTMMKEPGETVGAVAAVMKYLGDGRRLEILQKLSKECFYGMELAESMNMNTGNLSRSLATLCNYGFVRQERGVLRTYYQADRDAFHNFLEMVERAVFE